MVQQNKTLRDIIKEEYVKCASNPGYFMRKYAKIQHPVRGKILFELWDFQESVLKDFQNERYNICLKSRQLGISTLIAGYSLWLMLFQTDQNILVIATKQETAKNLVTKVRVMYDNLPSWLKTAVVEDNKLSLRFKNGSQIKAVSAAADAARSEALSLLIIDEAAFIDNIEEIWASAQSTINTGGSAIINSTPNGVGNFYHKQWVNAKTGTSAFNPIFLHWTVHPERDQAWRDQQDIILGPALAAQECDGDFLSSGQSVVDGNTIDWYQKTYVCEPREKRGAEGALWIWDDPDPNKTYMICADVARGDGKDYSAFHIMDIENIEQVRYKILRKSSRIFSNRIQRCLTCS
jgi:phage FluMu gp28-like protein